MRKLVAGALLAGTLSLGISPFVGTAGANTDDGTTDPVLCFVATQSIISEALHEFREGQLSAAELRSVLRGAAAFLGDCLTP